MGEEGTLDVVVVGAGVAGLACAYELAGAGLEVAVCERGDVAGAKNLTGGRLYLAPLRKLCGELLEGAPFERTVVAENIVLTDKHGSASLRVDRAGDLDPPHSVTVLRARLDAFLAQKVSDRGAFVMGEQRAEGLVRDGDKVVGVKVGGEDLFARVVVAADGALSFLAQEAGLRKGRPVAHGALGAKETIKLSAQVIEDRFNVGPGEGVASLYLGEVSRGLPGGGFLYTNRDTISLGVVVGLEALGKLGDDAPMSALTEAFKSRPEIAALIRGGELVEYGAHMIPEGGLRALPTLGVPGMLLVGDAAGLVLNTGHMLRGMDLAMASGVIAARSIIAFKDGQPGSIECLDHYRRGLDESFVMAELRAHAKAPQILSNERIYDLYPREILRAAREVFRVGEDGSATSVGKTVKQFRKNVGTWRALRDALRLLKI